MRAGGRRHAAVRRVADCRAARPAGKRDILRVRVERHRGRRTCRRLNRARESERLGVCIALAEAVLECLGLDRRRAGDGNRPRVRRAGRGRFAAVRRVADRCARCRALERDGMRIREERRRRGRGRRGNRLHKRERLCERLAFDVGVRKGGGLDRGGAGDGNRPRVRRAGLRRLAAIRRVADRHAGRRALERNGVGGCVERCRRRRGRRGGAGGRDGDVVDRQVIRIDGAVVNRELSVRGGRRDARLQVVALHGVDLELVSVEVDGRASVNHDLAERAPVAVGAELHGLRAGAEREVLRRERILARTIDLDHKGRDEVVAAFDDASAVAATRIAGDETETVPALRHLHCVVVLAHRFVHKRPFVVDLQRDVVVAIAMDCPDPGLRRSHVHPAVVAELRAGEEVGGLVVVVGIDVDAEQQLIDVPRNVDRGIVAHFGGNGEAGPSLAGMRLGTAVAKLHLTPVGRIAGRNGEGNAARGRDDHRRLLAGDASDAVAVLVEARPLRTVREVGDRRRAALPRGLRDVTRLGGRNGGEKRVRPGRRVRRKLCVAQHAVPDAHLVVVGVGVTIRGIKRMSKIKDGIRKVLDAIREHYAAGALEEA